MLSEHDVVEHLVVGQPRRVLGIRPHGQLLVDPRRLADRRVGKAEAQGFRACALQAGVGGAGVTEGDKLRDRGPFVRAGLGS
jgi:hypothetical protein